MYVHLDRRPPHPGAGVLPPGPPRPIAHKCERTRGCTSICHRAAGAPDLLLAGPVTCHQLAPLQVSFFSDTGCISNPRARVAIIIHTAYAIASSVHCYTAVWCMQHNRRYRTALRSTTEHERVQEQSMRTGCIPLAGSALLVAAIPDRPAR